MSYVPYQEVFVSTKYIPKVSDFRTEPNNQDTICSSNKYEKNDSPKVLRLGYLTLNVAIQSAIRCYAELGGV